jgi:hypothetical protein
MPFSMTAIEIDCPYLPIMVADGSRAMGAKIKAYKSRVPSEMYLLFARVLYGSDARCSGHTLISDRREN